MSRNTKARERWVVKVGSSTVEAGGPSLIHAWMRQVATLKATHAVDVLWVTSGAISTAMRAIGHRQTKNDFHEKQALSAIGQPLLMEHYNAGLKAMGLTGSQLLLTMHDMVHAPSKANLATTLELILRWGTVPIVNENDVAARPAERFRDNDWLSAMLAELVGARRLILCTDVDGLYDADPTSHPEAKIIPELGQISAALLESVRPDAGTKIGAGGMQSKLAAAKMATESGIEAWLVRGQAPDALLRIAVGDSIGTRIPARIAS